MVKIKVKCNFDIQFLVESSLTTRLADLVPELVRVYNGILRIRSAIDRRLAEDDARLWWAGKELTKDKELRDFVGNNEKTTIIATLSSSSVMHQTRATDEACKDFLLAQLKRENESDPLETEASTLPRDTRTLQRSMYGLSEVRWKL
ncbi:hypothetical protein HPB47_020104 [Ixodes persulcatus]|uniref:Uncharacterized protein n=1 Tax=Ixodes persulcatus TaxID=34615 RepID=A0AC60QGB1_IXOPE|nr:hypothetical protein HPB47_020104 [Ixodes persulcatus]